MVTVIKITASQRQGQTTRQHRGTFRGNENVLHTDMPWLHRCIHLSDSSGSALRCVHLTGGKFHLELKTSFIMEAYYRD